MAVLRPLFDDALRSSCSLFGIEKLDALEARRSGYGLFEVAGVRVSRFHNEVFSVLLVCF